MQIVTESLLYRTEFNGVKLDFSKNRIDRWRRYR